MMEESPFVEMMRERYEKDEMPFAEEADFLFLINAPEAYQNEDEMLSFLKENPEATMSQVMEHFEQITPPGLPPGMTEVDLMDDEE